MRTIMIILLVVTPLLAVLSFVGQAKSQVPVISLSTTSEFSTMTIGTTTLAELTTSAYSPASGEIPGIFSPYEGPTICFYVPFPFHVDDTAQKIQGMIAGSSPFNFYIMSKSQYDYFVLASPPCGSSYHALKLEYSIRSFTVDWTAPFPGDYYILLENTSMYDIAYNIQLSTIESASTLVYSTTAVVRTLTFIEQQEINTTVTHSEFTSPPETNFTIPIGIALIAVLIMIVAVAKRSKRSK